MEKRVIGVYDNGEEAVRAIEELKAQGYDRDDISVVAKDQDEVDVVKGQTGSNAEDGLTAGAATGGVLGGTAGLLAGIGALAIPGIGPILAAGPIAATLTGAALGAGAGGLAGALIGMGIPEDEADRYERDVKDGKLLVLLDPGARKTNNAENTGNAYTDMREESVLTDKDSVRRY
ncbi:general stress protein [Bacillus sp. CECT 9360]|uniref:general stress protein n=1 Tax=Bacillus sp. CECT 9360 TaxID=2845821 RepID=UPI001E359DF4|nr:general stress protein [Bacillus sp. CECT 9360]CAH0345235.1 hypothetical protein BCI9360_01515 [Bacillus sp. CECT 9360]